MNSYLKYIFLLSAIIAGFINPKSHCQGWEKNGLSELISEIHESIVIQTDRSTYADGEEIWFSASCFINGRKPEIILSRVLYVELYNQHSESIFRGKYDMPGNTCQGSFTIPEETRSGVYFLRAYTAFMRNFAPENFFTTTINIVNPQLPPDWVIHHQDEIRVVAEKIGTGKDENLRCALKISPALINKAKKVEVAGIPDAARRPIDAEECGVAYFTLPAMIENKPFVIVTLNNGDTLSQEIEYHANPALTISTRWDPENLVAEMTGKPPLESQFTLTAYSAGYIKMVSAEQKVTNGKTIFVLPRQKLAQGLNYLALADDRQQTVRLTIVYNFYQPEGFLVVKTNKDVYRCREKVEIQLEGISHPGDVQKLAFLMVVRKKGTAQRISVNPITTAHIQNPILLSSLLIQGKYPGKPDDELIRAICMLQSATLDIADFEKNTTKYRNLVLEYLPEIRGITINGKVLDKPSHQPIEGLTVYSSALYGNPQVNVYKTRNEGRFVIPLHQMEDSYDVFICPSPYVSGSAEILVNQDFAGSYPEFKPVAFPFDSTSRLFLNGLINNARINAVFNLPEVHEKIKVKTAPLYFGTEKTVIRPDDYISLKNMKEVFTEIIPVVKVRKSGNRHRLIVTDDHANFLPGAPLILIDNMPVFDADQVLQIHPSQVDRIEVINKVYVLGDHPLNGIIMIFTKTDNFGGIERPAQSVFAEFQTLEKTKPFSSPEYLSEKERSSPKPDFRNVLYWNPQVNSSVPENSLGFYASDFQGDYEIIIQGVDKEGKIIFGKSEFTVAR